MMTPATGMVAETAEATEVEIRLSCNYRIFTALKFNSFVAPICTRARSVVARKTAEVEIVDALVGLAPAAALVDRNAVPV